ncbi:MAG: hypothetical protein IJU95_01965 [Treponema sp.]|nr:hypothetical protein [Treponema sp.]
MLKARDFIMILPCLLAAFCCPPVLLSCNGNGGGGDSYGDVYTPGGGLNNAGRAGGVNALEILELSNAGDIEAIIAILSGGGSGTDTAQTQAVTLRAADIGLPAGGTATLTISGGGVDWTATAGADSDGNVTFEIPAIASGTKISVSLQVKNAAGTLLYAGSKKQTVSGGSDQIQISLARQYWTLPDSIFLSASPDGFAYDSTKLSETTTLSISGLEDAPAGAAITYAWELDSSPLSDTGSSITRSWSELIGASAPISELTKTFTVTASYTDEAGEAKTASASTSVVIGPPVTIPAFTVKIIANSTNSENSSGTDYAFYSTYGGSFTFKVEEPESFFPSGTAFSWSITKSGGTSPVTATGMSVTKTLEALGLSSAGVSESWTVTCTASNARAAAPVTGGGDSSVSGRVLKLPKFHLTVSAAGNNTANSSGSTYAFISASGAKFTVTPELDSGETAVTGMKYYWTVEGSSISSAEGASGDGHIDVDVSGLSGISGTTSVSPGSWNVGCSLKYSGFSSESASTTLSAFMLKIPDFTISVSAGSGLNESPSSSASSRVFLVSSSADLSKTIKLTATAKAGEPDFPTGTTFTWSSAPASPTTSLSSNAQVSAFCTVVPADQTDCTVSCTAQFTGLADVGPKEATFALKKPAKLNPPKPRAPEVRFSNGPNSNTRNASGSAGSYTVTVYNGTATSNINIMFRWSAADTQPDSAAGKTVKYKIYKSSGTLVGTASGTDSSYYTLSALGGSIGNPCTVTLTSYIEGVADPEESDPVTVTLTVSYE